MITMGISRVLGLIGISSLLSGINAHSLLPNPDRVFIEELVCVEARCAIDRGKITIIFPTGDTEQNGSQMVLGKHNYLVKYKTGEIATKLDKSK